MQCATYEQRVGEQARNIRYFTSGQLVRLLGPGRQEQEQEQVAW